MASEQNLASSQVLSSPPHTMCGKCGADQERLHHFYHRSNIRRLCTTCLLRLSPTAFCPHCFSSPPPYATALCIKCYSLSHLECVRTALGPAIPTPYICPLCQNPGAPIFKPKKTKSGLTELDAKSARMLSKAADIAASSMAKAAKIYRAVAEKRAMEAAEAKEAAEEAVKHVIDLQERFNAQKLGHPLPEFQASGSGSLGQMPSEVSTIPNAGGITEEDRVDELQQTQKKHADGQEENLGSP